MSMFGFGGGGDGKEGGIAQRWNPDKGSGFIKPDAGGADLLCPASSIEDGNALREGDAVKFKKGKDSKGKDCAEQVMPPLHRP